MRRSRRSRPVSMLGAFLIEVGTMLAFVALAQPTWTRNIIEQVTTSPAATSVVTSTGASTAAMFDAVVNTPQSNIPQAVALQPTLAHQTLRPTLPQQAALPHVSAPALLNIPAPAWSNTAWDNSARSSASPQRAIVNNSAVNNVNSSQGWQPSVTSSSSPPWSDTAERVAQANWSASRLPAAEARYAPQYPVYPPSNWSNSY